MYLFKGYVDRKKIDEDVEKLTAYYRSFGFFQAKIGRYMEFDDKQKWLTLTFVVNEGPRYKVRSVAFLGTKQIPESELGADLKLHGDQFFDQGAMNKDLSTIRDLYGGKGYVFADIQADPRFLDEPAKLDLMYNIKEGSRYRVGKITINIQGDSTHTHSRVVLDRLSLHPGDILDTRKLRGDERRLKASSDFATDPTKAPKITFSPLPGSDDPDRAIAERPSDRRGGAKSSGSRAGESTPVFRGQSPDADDLYCRSDRQCDNVRRAGAERCRLRRTASGRTRTDRS